MEITDQEKQTLKATAELVWRKGAHNPQEAAVAFQFTQYVERVLGPEKSQMPKSTEKEKGK